MYMLCVICVHAVCDAVSYAFSPIIIEKDFNGINISLV